MEGPSLNLHDGEAERTLRPLIPSLSKDRQTRKDSLVLAVMSVMDSKDSKVLTAADADATAHEAQPPPQLRESAAKSTTDANTVDASASATPNSTNSRNSRNSADTTCKVHLASEKERMDTLGALYIGAQLVQHLLAPPLQSSQLSYYTTQIMTALSYLLLKMQEQIDFTDSTE